MWKTGTAARHGKLSYRWTPCIGAVVPMVPISYQKEEKERKIVGEKQRDLWNLNKAVVCPKTRRKKKYSLVGGVTVVVQIKAEARLPEGIKERVMMATTRGARESMTTAA